MGNAMFAKKVTFGNGQFSVCQKGTFGNGQCNVSKKGTFGNFVEGEREHSLPGTQNLMMLLNKYILRIESVK
jgi:hypothetical protein